MEDLDTFIASYHPDKRAIEAVRSVKTVFLVGISGAGKDSIKQRLLGTGHYHDVVSHTTRTPRENRGRLEADGIEYHFVSMDTMLKMLEDHELIEANRYSNNIYATSTREFELARDEERIAITDIDINGVEAYKNIAPRSVLPIFLVPPSYEIWRSRWRLRYGSDYMHHMDDFERRKETAIKELRYVLDTPYYFYVINDDLNRATQEVERIVEAGRQSKATYEKGKSVVEAILREMEAS